MEVQDRFAILVRQSARRLPSQPTPRLRQPAGGDGGLRESQRCEQPAAGQADVSLLHLVDLRRRYREEAVTLRQRVLALQQALEDCSRQLWYGLTAGQPAPAALRARCDDLVQAVADAERDLADVHLAIAGVGDEITTLVDMRHRAR
jgi:hypothetical protein